MPVWLHLAITVLAQALALGAGLFAYYSFHIPEKIRPFMLVLPEGAQKFAWIAWFLAVVATCTMIPLMIISRFVPARCRKQDCGGWMYLTSNLPFTYRCRRCKEIYETAISQGGRR